MITLARLPGSSLARWAAYVAVLLGLVLIFRGVELLLPPREARMPYSITLVIIGALQMMLSYYVLKANRASWAFLTSLNGTLFVVALFGAPKIRDELQVDMALALLPCLLFGVVTLLAAFAAQDFER